MSIAICIYVVVLCVCINVSVFFLRFIFYCFEIEFLFLVRECQESFQIVPSFYVCTIPSNTDDILLYIFILFFSVVAFLLCESNQIEFKQIPKLFEILLLFIVYVVIVDDEHHHHHVDKFI